MIYKLAKGKTFADLEKHGFKHCSADDYFIMYKGDDDLVGVIVDTETNGYGVIASRDDSPTIETLLKLGIIEPKR